jgi:hypothetical protein
MTTVPAIDSLCRGFFDLIPPQQFGSRVDLSVEEPWRSFMIDDPGMQELNSRHRRLQNGRPHRPFVVEVGDEFISVALHGAEVSEVLHLVEFHRMQQPSNECIAIRDHFPLARKAKNKRPTRSGPRTPPGKKQMLVIMDEKLIKELKLAMTEDDTAASHIVEQLVRDWLAKRKSDK